MFSNSTHALLWFVSVRTGVCAHVHVCGRQGSLTGEARWSIGMAQVLDLDKPGSESRLGLSPAG